MPEILGVIDGDGDLWMKIPGEDAYHQSMWGVLAEEPYSIKHFAGPGGFEPDYRSHEHIDRKYTIKETIYEKEPEVTENKIRVEWQHGDDFEKLREAARQLGACLTVTAKEGGITRSGDDYKFEVFSNDLYVPTATSQDIWDNRTALTLVSSNEYSVKAVVEYPAPTAEWHKIEEPPVGAAVLYKTAPSGNHAVINRYDDHWGWGMTWADVKALLDRNAEDGIFKVLND